MAPFLVCFVCSGNICRSPTAEVVFRDMVERAGLSGQVVCSSAGTGGWHAGQPADPRAARALLDRGYDPGGHRARQWQRTWWDEHDLVVALDSGHLHELRRQAPPGQQDKVVLLRSFDPATAGQQLDVPDPYYGGERGFLDVLDLVEGSCAGLLADIRRRLAG